MNQNGPAELISAGPFLFYMQMPMKYVYKNISPVLNTFAPIITTRDCPCGRCVFFKTTASAAYAAPRVLQFYIFRL